MDTIKTKAYSTTFKHLTDLEAYVGKELGLSEWIPISQERIDTFAACTGDDQWIHTDPEKSAQHSPYKKTVAHGFLVLSLGSKFAYDCYTIEDVVMGVNYGLDKVRFPNATLVDAKIRGRIFLQDYKEIEKGARFKLKIVFEIEGEEKPACVAEIIGQAYIG